MKIELNTQSDNIQNVSTKDITDKLTDTSRLLENLKNKMGESVNKIGHLQDITHMQIEAWKSLEHSTLPTSVTTSGVALTNYIHTNTQALVVNYDNLDLSKYANSLGTAVESLTGAMASGASLCLPPQEYTTKLKTIENVLNTNKDIESTALRLENISKSLAEEYKNTWFEYNTLPTDNTRSPLYSLRNVLTQMLHHFAPDEAIPDSMKELIDNKLKITRNSRIKYILSILPPEYKTVFETEARTYITIFDELNKAHTPNSISLETSRGTLLIANGLIKLLLDCFNL